MWVIKIGWKVFNKKRNIFQVVNNLKPEALVVNTALKSTVGF